MAESNKDASVSFLKLAASGKVREAYSKFVGAGFRHHAGAPAASLEAELERGIERRFGLSIPIFVRAGADWPAYVKGNPYPEASQKEPNLVMLVLSKAPPNGDAVEGLREHALSGERIVQVGDGLWIHYASGVGRSKLSPALLDRLVGSPVTARNWRTVLKLDEMARHSMSKK
jgi:uncharacterized protein (DUF1697 family)